MEWCTIESDPGVFTELIQTFGVKGIQVEELYSLDDLEHTAPIYGLVFLFKYVKETDERATMDAEQEPGLFFAKQVIQDACATQAILSVLLNLQSPEGVDIGDTLKDFRGFTGEFPSDLKGLAISNSEPIRTAHNSFARAEPFMMEKSKRAATEDDDVFHFIAYVPYNGKVYELDGLKSGPILLGDVAEGGDWLTVAKQQLQARIEKYASSEIRFNLMGLVRNKKDALAEEAAMLTRRKAALEAAATGAAAMGLGSSDGLGAGWTMAEDAGGRTAQLTETQDALAACVRAQQEEDAKVAAWKMENLRRKHNYVPFVVNLLRILAERKHLTPMYEKAKEKKKEQAAAGGGKK